MLPKAQTLLVSWVDCEDCYARLLSDVEHARGKKLDEERDSVVGDDNLGVRRSSRSDVYD